MHDDRRIFEVIEEIYEAGADAGDLDKLAFAIARTFDTESGFIGLNVMPRRGALDVPAMVEVPSATENFDEWARSAYAGHYHERNIWLARAVELGMPPVVTGDELVGKSVLMRSEWYEFCRKLDAFHVLGSLVPIADDVLCQVGVHRPRNASAFDEVAERALRSEDALTTLGRRLQLHAADQTSLLARLVHAAARTSAGNGLEAGGTVAAPRRSGGRLALTVSPIRAWRMGLGPAKPAAAIVFSDTDTDGATTAHERALADVYSLTPAEARLLAALAAGQTVAQYARLHHIGLGTARTHLKHVLEKTGYHRQTDLVRAVLLQPAMKMLGLHDRRERLPAP
jgi:DNA-binding CsgD family transcriptional regulator